MWKQRVERLTKWRDAFWIVERAHETYTYHAVRAADGSCEVVGSWASIEELHVVHDLPRQHMTLHTPTLIL